MPDPPHRRSRRIRGAAAVSLAATAGILGTYLGSPRIPRAYAQPGAPFEALFAAQSGKRHSDNLLFGNDARLMPSGSLVSATASFASAPACDVSVDDSVTLHAAVRTSVDDSVICIIDDIPDLREQLVIDDTNLTLVGAGGGDGLGKVALTADDTRHVYATFADPDGFLKISNLTLTQGDSGSSRGGSVFIVGDSLSNSTTELILSDSSFTFNDSGLGGGAVFGRGLEKVSVLSSVFEDNSAGVSGGALALVECTTTEALLSTFTRNYAGETGGAIDVVASVGPTRLAVYASTFRDDSAGIVGGAISAVGLGQPLVLPIFGAEDQPSLFQGNSAGQGGALFTARVGDAVGPSLVGTVGQVDFVDNAATAGDGGGILSYSDDTVFNFPVLPSLTMVADSRGFSGGATFSGNTASGKGGAVSVTGTADIGGYLYSAYARNLSPDIPIVPTGVSFSGNSAATGGAVAADGLVTTYRSAFTQNSATSGNGGAIAVDDSLVQTAYLSGVALVSSYFADNTAPAGRGGGVHIDDSAGVLYSIASTFTRNRSHNPGGAIYFLDDTGLIVNSTFTGNQASRGGAVFMKYAYLVVDFSTVTGNDANSEGGIVARRLQVTNSIVNNNYVDSGPPDALAYDSIDGSYSVFSSPTSMVAINNPWNPGPGTIFSADPVVGGLGDNGGFRVADDTVIPTMLPFAGSPVIDSADPNSSGTNFFPGNFDERGEGFPRIVGGRADMGAVERQAAPVPPVPSPASSPRNVQVVPGDRKVDVTWQAPSSSGSFPITSYQAVATADGEQGSAGPSCLATAPALTCTITGLTDGQTYTVRVRALTGAGWGAFSDPSEPFTPQPPEVKSIVITGTREGRQTVVVQGATSGLVGERVRAQVRLQGQAAYVAGSTRVVDEAGEFTWRRQTRKKTYVYFVAEDGAVRSNRLIIRR